MNLAPLKFKPIFKSVLWGGDRITQLKHMPDITGNNIGESWEVSAMPGNESVVDGGTFHGASLPHLVSTLREQLVGNEVYKVYGNDFPLLIKIIDAHDRLSVQVHPDDELAAQQHHSPGKTEMWYIIDAAPQACIMAGVNRELTVQEFDTLLASGHITDCITTHRSKPGDVYFLPAGTIHSIGAGNLLVEIQQASDITYRLYDFDRRDASGNKRQLHTELARRAVSLTPSQHIASHCNAEPQSVHTLASCKHFDVKLISPCGTLPLQWTPMKSFMVIVCTMGSMSITTHPGCITHMRAGETILVPACAPAVTAQGTAQAITAIIN